MTSPTQATPTKYFSLVIRFPGTPWGIAFGDYDREVVRQEFIDEYSNERDLQSKIIGSPDDQPSINAAVAALNARI